MLMWVIWLHRRKVDKLSHDRNACEQVDLRAGCRRGVGVRMMNE